jgi:hypothetical protein
MVELNNKEAVDPQNLLIRASYLAGEVGVEHALRDLAGNGYPDREIGLAILARPMSVERVFNLIGQDVTQEQIMASVFAAESAAQ